MHVGCANAVDAHSLTSGKAQDSAALPAGNAHSAAELCVLLRYLCLLAVILIHLNRLEVQRCRVCRRLVLKHPGTPRKGIGSCKQDRHARRGSRQPYLSVLLSAQPPHHFAVQLYLACCLRSLRWNAALTVATGQQHGFIPLRTCRHPACQRVQAASLPAVVCYPIQLAQVLADGSTRVQVLGSMPWGPDLLLRLCRLLVRLLCLLQLSCLLVW